MFKTQNLYQNDDKWKNVKLGNSNETIGSWGCLLTSVTMMLNGLGYSETPLTVNEKMRKAGGFQGALFIPSVVPYVWPACIYRDMQPCQMYPAPITLIDAAVAAGKPVILQVDWNKQVGIQTHFVLIKEKRADDYVIYDPYQYSGDGPDKDVLLTARYKYNGRTLESEIMAVLWFDCYSDVPAKPPKMTGTPLPAEKYVVYAGEDDLALRAEPSPGGFLWKRLLAGTELSSLEPKASAQAKLGQQGQWIHVQDPHGDQGYVAAWFVSEESADAAPPAATAESAPAVTLPAGALALLPTEALAFRSQPVISPQTLIRQIPVTEQLVSLEPAGQAIPKIGVMGKWLKVRDASNQPGYVAAWYVKYASGSTAQAAAKSALPSGDLKVKTACEGVALRREPVISDATLIKRVPINYEFTIIEPGGESKVGANNQWIRVKDPSGPQGYVAAWFITR